MKQPMVVEIPRCEPQEEEEIMHGGPDSEDDDNEGYIEDNHDEEEEEEEEEEGQRGGGGGGGGGKILEIDFLLFFCCCFSFSLISICIFLFYAPMFLCHKYRSSHPFILRLLEKGLNKHLGVQRLRLFGNLLVEPFLPVLLGLLALGVVHSQAQGALRTPNPVIAL